MDTRCNECMNCRVVELTRLRVLANCNPPFTHASQDVIDVWNRTLEDHPCTGRPKSQPSLWPKRS